MCEDYRVATGFQPVLHQHRESKIDLCLGHLAEVFFIQCANVAEPVPCVQYNRDRTVGKRRFADGAHLGFFSGFAAGREQKGKQHRYDKETSCFFHVGPPVTVSGFVISVALMIPVSTVFVNMLKKFLSGGKMPKRA